MRTFAEWVESRKPGPVVPQCDLVLRIIRDAGKNGIDRGSIGSQIDLPKELLDDLLATFSGITVTLERGQRIYRVG